MALIMAESGWCGLLLAAGHATRFGADKLLRALPDGTPVALASARAMQAVLPRVAAVVRRDNRPLWDLLQSAGVELIEAPTEDEGMGASLASGVRATVDAAGWIVALADMPFVRPETFASVLSALQSGALLAAPSYQGRRGHPVGFHRRYYSALESLTGDQGARALLQSEQAHLWLIARPDPGILRDIDVPEDISGVSTEKINVITGLSLSLTLLIYRLAGYAMLNLLDDAAMLAMIFT